MKRLNKTISVLVLLAGSFLLGHLVIAQDFQSNRLSDAKWIEYERKLNAILKTRRDEEKEYVKRVVAQVRANKIPARLVATSFDWARHHRPNTKYPFIYFERILCLQGTKIGIKDEIPPFSFAIYSQPASK